MKRRDSCTNYFEIVPSEKQCSFHNYALEPSIFNQYLKVIQNKSTCSWREQRVVESSTRLQLLCSGDV